MWIKAHNGNVYRREAFYLFEVESGIDAGIQHHNLRARMTPPPGGQSLSGLKAADPGAILLGEFKTADQAQQALSRLFPDRNELIDMSGIL